MMKRRLCRPVSESVSEASNAWSREWRSEASFALSADTSVNCNSSQPSGKSVSVTHIQRPSTRSDSKVRTDT